MKKRLGEAVASTETVPTDTIIAFGNNGNNEIWRRGTNKWTEWEKGRDCGRGYACVKAHSNIYIIGGERKGQPYSPETDIYDISKEQWSKGPQLNVARLDVQRFRTSLPRGYDVNLDALFECSKLRNV